jgi:hypothetical protein
MRVLLWVAVLLCAAPAQAETRRFDLELDFDFSEGIAEAGGYLGLGLIDTAFLVHDVIGRRSRTLAVLEVIVAVPQLIAFGDEAAGGEPLHMTLALGAGAMLAHGIYVLATHGEAPPPVTPVISADGAGFVAAGRF